MSSKPWIRRLVSSALVALVLSMAISAGASEKKESEEPALDQIKMGVETPTNNFPRVLRPGDGMFVIDGDIRLVFTLGELVFILDEDDYTRVQVNAVELELRRLEGGGGLGRWTIFGIGVGTGAALVLGIIAVDRKIR